MFLSSIKNQIKTFIKLQKESDPIDLLTKKYSLIVRKIEQRENGTFLMEMKSGIQLACRNFPHSDFLVFDQVFIDQEYLSVSSLFLNKSLKSHGNFTIIDAGANVGYTSLYLKNHFPHSTILSIEPDDQNFKQLIENISLNSFDNSVFPIQKALLGESGINLSTQKDFRDGKDWAITVEKTDAISNLQSISIIDLIKEYEIKNVDILKIDIEGAERFLFTEENDLSYLKKVKTIIIEIHDEFNCRELINHSLAKNDFMLIDLGESTLGINKNFI
jgi:FkbM family methyltransferase